jgi:hypothetical protein
MYMFLIHLLNDAKYQTVVMRVLRQRRKVHLKEIAKDRIFASLKVYFVLV